MIHHDSIREPLAYGPKPPERILDWTRKQIYRLLSPSANENSEWEGLARACLDTWTMNAAAALNDEEVAYLQDELLVRYIEQRHGSTGPESDNQIRKFLRAKTDRDEAFISNEMVISAVEEHGPIPRRDLIDSIRRGYLVLHWLVKVDKVHFDGENVVAGPDPNPKLPVEPAPTPSTVPPFMQYSTRRRHLKTDAQKEFYTRYKVAALEGELLDLEGQLSYGFLLLFEVLTHKRLAKKSAQVVRLLADKHAGDTLGEYAAAEFFRYHLLREDFEAFVAEFDGRPVPLSYHINLLTTPVGAMRLLVRDVDHAVGTSGVLTDFGETHRDAVREQLQHLLDDEFDAHGMSAIHKLWFRVITPEKTPEGPLMAEEFEGRLDDYELREHIRWALKQFESSEPSSRYPDGRPLEFHPSLLDARIPWPGYWRQTGSFEQLAQVWLRVLYRRAENLVRENAGVPLVGEGHYAEVTLLNLVRNAFPNHRVVHQGRPYWLLPQSFDIWFPDHEVAVEYQGAQHFGPIEYFGGRVGFENQQRRDHRKRQLSAKYGCTLIEVRPGYDQDATLEQIREALTLRRA